MNESPTRLQKDYLNQVVEAVKVALHDEKMRSLNQRAIQAKLWQNRLISSYMGELRRTEDCIRSEIMSKFSSLIFRFHEHALATTLARSGVLSDPRISAGSSLDEKKDDFDIACLDAKERLYLILKNYGWLEEFFRYNPEHFYENSFQFVDRIPPKQLPVKVNVVGLGIGGSLAVSGLAKAGIEVLGVDKRSRSGARSVSSRYQNASWRGKTVQLLCSIKRNEFHLLTY